KPTDPSSFQCSQAIRFKTPTVYGSTCCEPTNKIRPASAHAGVAAREVSAKVISPKVYVERAGSLTTKFVALRFVSFVTPRSADIRRRRSRRLHTAHVGNRTDMEFDTG